MNISIFKKRILFVWTFILLLFRPSLLGERFNPVIFFFFLATTGLLFLIDPETNKRYINKKIVFAFLLILLIVIYFLLQGLLLSSAKKTVINSIVVILGTSICIAYVSRKDNISHIFTSFINIFFWLGLSAIITYTIIIFCSFDDSKMLLLTNLNFLFPGYETPKEVHLIDHLLFFPFTIVSGSVKFLGITFPRFIGIFREPGMTQLFFVTAYFLTYFVDIKRAKLKRFIIMIGSVLTFSTAGLLSFLGGFLMLKLFSKGKMPSLRIVTTTVISLIIITFIFATIPGLGFLNKISSESGEERSKSYSNSIKILSDSPIVGTGYYNDFIKNKNDVVVSNQFLGILGVAYQIGIVGLALYLIIWYYGLSRLGNIQTLCIYMPCLLTLLISQPSYNDVIVFFLILTDTSNLKLVSLK